jgi:hypothetical protein
MGASPPLGILSIVRSPSGFRPICCPIASSAGLYSLRTEPRRGSPSTSSRTGVWPASSRSPRVGRPSTVGPPLSPAGVGRMQSAVLFAGIPGPDRKLACSLIRQSGFRWRQKWRITSALRLLLHLLYQVQIRLGSPRTSPGCFCSRITAIASPRPLTRRPASVLPRSS